MNEKDALMKAEAFAKQILRSYFCDSDVEFLISTFAEDIAWMGAGTGQIAEGIEKVAAYFRGGKDQLVPCNILDEQYITKKLGEHLFLCEGQYRLESIPSVDFFLRISQKNTFIFEEIDGHLWTKHIHNSVDYTEIDTGELFPEKSGKDAYERLQAQVNKATSENIQRANFLAQLYNSMPCGILQFTADYDHKIISINPMVWKFYGFSSEAEYREKIDNPIKLVLETEQESIEEKIQGLKLNGGSINYSRKVIKNNGSISWISVIMERLVNESGMDVIQAIFTDITEIKALQTIQEQERILENRALRTAMCTAYPLIMSINLTLDTYNNFIADQEYFADDRQGCFTQLINDAAEKVYPSYRDDFLNKFSRKKILHQFAKGEPEIYFELRMLGNDDEYHWISIHIIYVENPINDDVLAIELIKVLDIQRAEKAQQEQLLRDALAEAKAANNAKSDFLSRMSHDIRTPMNAIIGMTDIGQLKADDPVRVLDCFKKIDTASHFLLSLINDILDMSKIENGKMVLVMEKFDLNDFLTDVISVIRPQAINKDIKFEVYHQEPMEHYFIGDTLRLKQILMNLLSNALKFTPRRGKISIDIREQDKKEDIAQIQFCVSDTGIGISEAYMTRIFQPFEQESSELARNNVGSGLGLSIVYNLTQLMGGTIDVQSKKGFGTSFTVTMPMKISEPSPKPLEYSGSGNPSHVLETAECNSYHFMNRRLLLVEDNMLNSEIAKELLERYELIVDVAENGQIAVEKFGEKPYGYYFAILMDIRMPVMDGLEATRKIRKLENSEAMQIPILAMTANAFDEDRAMAYEAGMNGYLIKPLDLHEILEALKVYCV